MLSVNTMQHKGNTYVINFLNYLSTYANVWHQIIHCLGIHFSGVSKLSIVKQKNVLKRPLLTPINEPLTYSDCPFRYASLSTSTVMSWSLMLCFVCHITEHEWGSERMRSWLYCRISKQVWYKLKNIQITSKTSAQRCHWYLHFLRLKCSCYSFENMSK